MKISVLTVFPDMYAAMHQSVIGRALEHGAFALDVINIRDYSTDKHHRTDDYPFGGGAGMVMTPQPIHDCIQAVDPDHRCTRIFLSPRGQTFTQSMAKQLAQGGDLLLLCGSYEGVDQRVIDMDIDGEISIGDYVLTSGDLAAMVVINAVSRHIPGVLGSEQSAEDESFSDRLLEYPQYTRPQDFLGATVPDVLLSGNHAQIAAWRKEQQFSITKQRRPDLLVNKPDEPPLPWCKDAPCATCHNPSNE